MDAWSDTKNIMTMCVHSRGETFFLSSKEALIESQTGTSIFECVHKYIEDVSS